ncbi:ammonium transporter [Brevibacterium litoralis]|uniref:ammonium transporter n=1 Tax=Brevibacterium litoralis TaxID=3138935 RepID=UPI0032EDFE09
MDAVIAVNADLAWMLTALALLLLMIPGLALFYGGMLGARNTLNMMVMVFGALAVAAIVYIVYGYGFVHGPTMGGLGILGDPRGFFGMDSAVLTDDSGGGIGTAYFAIWFVMFAGITVAIVASGGAGRMKLGGWITFVAVWLTLVYLPVAHWVFAADGFLLDKVGVIDFAGGTAVHMNSGTAALALALVLGARRNRFERPHNVPQTMLGAGLLFVGWLGFNGSCALAAGHLVQVVVLNTILAGCAGMLGYMLVEKLRQGHPTALGAATGMVAGLVAITPAAHTMGPLGALATGAIGAAVAALAISFKSRLKVDESLDAFMVHGLAGIAGTLCIVLFANPAAPAGIGGLLTGDGLSHALPEVIGILTTVGFSFVMTFAIAWVLDKTIGLRAPEQQEQLGLDQAIHAETAYEISLVQFDHGAFAPRTAPVPAASAPAAAGAAASPAGSAGGQGASGAGPVVRTEEAALAAPPEDEETLAAEAPATPAPTAERG